VCVNVGVGVGVGVGVDVGMCVDVDVGVGVVGSCVHMLLTRECIRACVCSFVFTRTCEPRVCTWMHGSSTSSKTLQGGRLRSPGLFTGLIERRVDAL
jgi:hypothetical protein